MAINAWLAEGKAAAGDAYGADEALERAAGGLDQARAEGPVGTGFCSTAGNYSGFDEAFLEGHRGAAELSLRRASAVDSLTISLRLNTNPTYRANILASLAETLIFQQQPEEACARLVEAHIIGLRCAPLREPVLWVVFCMTESAANGSLRTLIGRGPPSAEFLLYRTNPALQLGGSGGDACTDSGLAGEAEVVSDNRRIRRSTLTTSPVVCG